MLYYLIGMTDVARRMLGSMQRRDVRQKFILGFLAVFLILAITLVAVYAGKK